MTVNPTPEDLKKRFPRLLGRLEAGDLGTLLHTLEWREVEPGEELCRNAEYCDAMHLLWEGELRLSLWLSGREITIGNIGPGQFVGVVSLIDPGPALLTVTVAEPSRLLRLDHPGLIRLRGSHPRAGGNLLRALSLDLTAWLRSYEAYIAHKTGPNSIEAFFRIGRLESHIELMPRPGERRR
jgi:CRP-like cAMP-binding protein